MAILATNNINKEIYPESNIKHADKCYFQKVVKYEGILSDDVWNGGLEVMLSLFPFRNLNDFISSGLS